MEPFVEVVHNLDPRAFKWLFAKYVRGFNENQHCTNSIRGWYSKKFTRLDPIALSQVPIKFDERPLDMIRAIYICGVSRSGYAKKENYPHNLHLAIEPAAGVVSEWGFEEWRVTVTHGKVLPIPSQEQLPHKFRDFPPPFTTCRIFRWAAVYFSQVN